MTFDVIEKQLSFCKVNKSHNEEIPTARSMQLHHKDMGKRTQILESLMQVSYMQIEKKAEPVIPSVVASGLWKRVAKVEKKDLDSEAANSKIKQQIILRTIPYKALTKKSNKEKPVKVKEQSFWFKDDGVISYY